MPLSLTAIWLKLATCGPLVAFADTAPVRARLLSVTDVFPDPPDVSGLGAFIENFLLDPEEHSNDLVLPLLAAGRNPRPKRTVQLEQRSGKGNRCEFR